MTVSMPTTRLSSVMTGCGGNETTCSRRSISGFTRAPHRTPRGRARAPGRRDGQVDQRLDAVHERDHEGQARVQRALEAAEALDDAGAGLGDDADAHAGDH